MSIASDRGRTFEGVIAGLLKKKLGARVERDRRSGAGWSQRSDIRDYYQDIPFSIEVKNQEKLNVKEAFRQADEAANFNRPPIVVFNAEPDILCTLRFTDLLNMLVEVADQKAEIADLRLPTSPRHDGPMPTAKGRAALADLEPVVKSKIDRGVKTCRAGHIADQWGYCLQVECKYSRSYRKPKGKKKR